MSEYLLQWEFEISPLISALAAVAVFIVGLKVVTYMTESYIPLRSTHNWKVTSSHHGIICCNGCKNLIIEGEGRYCDCCGIHGDVACIVSMDKKYPCKAISLANKEPMKHHWVKGNLKPLSKCDVCRRECSITSDLKHYKCCWCLRTVHNKCKVLLDEICDFGHFKALIIPPASVEMVTQRSSLRSVVSLKSITPTKWPNWSPVLVLANCKSGSKEGEEILSKFRGLLNPGQVIDLGSKKPEVALQWCLFLKDCPSKILVAGGDGTVGWVLTTIVKLNLKPEPAVGIIPLGTGNDMSRVLGWGKSTSSTFAATAVLQAALEAETVPFDRWKVDIIPQHSSKKNPSHKEIFMYNYLSIGVDAQVTLDFHNARESPFYIFSSRLINKLLYLGYGTQQMIEKTCQRLNEKIDLYLDGEKINLPIIESIVVLNIDSWGAGVNLWKMSQTKENDSKQSYNDGKLEVVALYSSLHIAQLQVGLGMPYRVGQASLVQIKLNSSCAVQVDGEPWLQAPAMFEINHFNQTLMLKKL